jgi:hypothetical protein
LVQDDSRMGAGRALPRIRSIWRTGRGFRAGPSRAKSFDPFYARASRLCMFHGDYGRHGHNFSNEYWSKVLQAPVPAVDGFDTEMYQYLGPQYLNFATRTFEDGQTIAESAVEVILNASLL